MVSEEGLLFKASLSREATVATYISVNNICFKVPRIVGNMKLYDGSIDSSKGALMVGFILADIQKNASVQPFSNLEAYETCYRADDVECKNKYGNNNSPM